MKKNNDFLFHPDHQQFRQSQNHFPMQLQTLPIDPNHAHVLELPGDTSSHRHCIFEDKLTSNGSQQQSLQALEHEVQPNSQNHGRPLPWSSRSADEATEIPQNQTTTTVNVTTIDVTTQSSQSIEVTRKSTHSMRRPPSHRLNFVGRPPRNEKKEKSIIKEKLFGTKNLKKK